MMSSKRPERRISVPPRFKQYQFCQGGLSASEFSLGDLLLDIGMESDPRSDGDHSFADDQLYTPSPPIPTTITVPNHTNRRKSLKKKQRNKVKHDYNDHSQIVDTSCILAARPRMGRGGVTVPFPEKLYEMLSKAEEDTYDHIVGWQPHGRAFLIHKPKDFVENVMTKYFRQSKLTSFQRQLNLYGFRRITKGRDSGAYYHERLLRGRPELCITMTRVKVKGTGCKAANNPEEEPDFYSMPIIKVSDHGDVDPSVIMKMTIPLTPKPSINRESSMIGNIVDLPVVSPTSVAVPPTDDLAPLWTLLDSEDKDDIVGVEQLNRSSSVPSFDCNLSYTETTLDLERKIKVEEEEGI